MRDGVILATVLVGSFCGPPLALAQPPDAPIPTAKLNQYVKGYNFLIGTFGLPEEARLYAAQQIARKTANDPVNIADGWIGLGDDDLKKGRDMDGAGLGELDAAAEDMIPILDRLVERLKGLEAYYASRGQLADGFARGKREDRLVLADFQAALAALGPLDAALTRAIDRRDAAHLAALKAGGDEIGYNGNLALQRAQRLLLLTGTPAALHDPAALAAADALADGILAALSDEGAALDAAKADGSGANALRNSMYGTAAGDLRRLVGFWRDSKRAGTLALRPAMIGAYNAAIGNMNNAR